MIDVACVYLINLSLVLEQYFEDKYIGQFDTKLDFAYEIIETTGFLEGVPEQVKNYFDYESYVRDMEYNGEFFESNGYYFWNN